MVAPTRTRAVTRPAPKGAEAISAAIAADIDLNSTITATLRTFNTATGIISAQGADRVNGTRAGGGQFKLTSVTAAGATTVTDQSTYDVHIVALGTGT